ncbi:MAG: hypothetical protein JEY71_17745 [Sphaerochaeta sp.]|nr:hypothetical protein [Sphaerochaeta sp.]
MAEIERRLRSCHAFFVSPIPMQVKAKSRQTAFPLEGFDIARLGGSQKVRSVVLRYATALRNQMQA